MKSEIADEILEELASTFQKFETQYGALLEFVKDKGIVKEDELAPYMERAAAASAVRWRATRVRMARLLTSAANGDRHVKESGKAAEEQKSESHGEEHSQTENKETMKQAESLAKEPVEAQVEDDRAKRAKDTSEAPVLNDSGSQERKEKVNVETGGRRPSGEQSPGEAAERYAGNADQASDRKEGQPAAAGDRRYKSSDQQHGKRENKKGENAA